eukprot:SAG11_NODE_7728_length_1103_cov_1.330677_1_plen_180_part_01
MPPSRRAQLRPAQTNGSSAAHYRGSRVRADKPCSRVTVADYFSVEYADHTTKRTSSADGAPLNPRHESFGANLQRLGFDLDARQAERIAEMGGRALCGVVALGSGPTTMKTVEPPVPRRISQPCRRDARQKEFRRRTATPVTAMDSAPAVASNGVTISKHPSTPAAALASALRRHSRHGV